MWQCLCDRMSWWEDETLRLLRSGRGGETAQKRTCGKLLADPVPGSLALLQPPEREDKEAQVSHWPPTDCTQLNCPLVPPLPFVPLGSSESAWGGAGLRTSASWPRGGRPGGEGGVQPNPPGV